MKERTPAQNFAHVTRALNAMVRTIDEEYTCHLGSDFHVSMVTDKISWTFAQDAELAGWFRDDFISRYPVCADFDVFTLSLFHEVGHLENEWKIIKDDLAQRRAIHELAATDKKAANKKYFALYSERVATDWAGEYLTEHHDEMKIWEEKIIRMIKKVLDKYPD